MVSYADIWVYPDRIEVRRQDGTIAESIPVNHPPEESWREFVAVRVAPRVAERGWSHNAWHRPRGNDQLLATTFAWRGGS